LAGGVKTTEERGLSRDCSSQIKTRRPALYFVEWKGKYDAIALRGTRIGAKAYCLCANHQECWTSAKWDQVVWRRKKKRTWVKGHEKMDPTKRADE